MINTQKEENCAVKGIVFHCNEILIGSFPRNRFHPYFFSFMKEGCEEYFYYYYFYILSYFLIKGIILLSNLMGNNSIY